MAMDRMMQDASSYSNGYSETQSRQIGLHPSSALVRGR